MTRRLSGILGAIALCGLCAAPLSAQAKTDTTKHPVQTKVPPKTPPAATKAPPVKTAAQKADSAKKSAVKPDTTSATSVAERGGKGQLSIMREVFSYSAGGRRDPMVSLMSTGDIRPLLSEVEVIAIIYDEEGTNSEAVLRNLTDKKKLYHVKVGQNLGRMTVTQITRREVVFTLNEFGMSTQARLSVKPDTSASRTP